jgi:LacI family transcriptional regulator
MASLKQIAAELGISYTSVCKVLNGNLGTTGVSQATRERILSKSRELDYKANRLAVALKHGRTGAVGIFLHAVGGPGSAINERLILGIAAALESSGYRMWLRNFATDEEFVAACDEKLRREVDGLIIGGLRHPRLREKLQEIDSGGLPTVTVFLDQPDKPEQTSTTCNVGVDSEMQGYLAARHLLERGCRQLISFSVMTARTHGFSRALAEAGVKPRRIVPMNGFSFEEAEVKTRQLLEKAVKFDGIVAQSDAQAVGAINELLRHGLRVPEDVKVTGVDNSPLAEISIVPLTTVSSGVRRTGYTAVEVLLRRIEGERVDSVTLGPELIIRASSGGGVGAVAKVA